MDQFHEITLLLLIIFAAAKTVGVLCERIGIPSLIGELAGGILLGNLGLLGFHNSFMTEMQDSAFIHYAAELGVIFLLFLVGLESSMKSLLKAGVDSFITAVVGVVLPTLMGAGIVHLLGLGGGLQAWFVGATFAATSVGITAKMLAQYNKLHTPSAQVILGAAVIDDVLGLILLAVLAGIASTGEISGGALFTILLKTVLFFIGAFLLATFVMPHAFRLWKAIDQPGILTVLAVVIALGFSMLASLAGLAPIVGAFTAGILLDDVQLRHAEGLSRKGFEEVIRPVTDMLLPIFFVSIGIKVNLTTFSSWEVVLLVAVLLLLAFIGKAVCGFLCRGEGVNKLGVGLGMIPRGEVGLIFATFGLQKGILTPSLYSILVMVVLLTTILGPIAL
ncbi:MAG: cation:proton antiporter, partial [bacterium]|nr:cation:proton antiporter [bacterium]